MNKTILRKWLKAGYMEDEGLYPTTKGTPQGGIISPTIKIKSLIKDSRDIPAHGLIRLLNPVIRGWSNYHKGICAKKVFEKLGNFIFRQLKRWAKYQHGNKNRWWIFWRYFTNNHFTDKVETKKGIVYYRLYRISYVPIRYHVKIKQNANPYMPEYDKYFSRRQKWRENLARECKQITTFVNNEAEMNSRVTRHSPANGGIKSV